MSLATVGKRSGSAAKKLSFPSRLGVLGMITMHNVHGVKRSSDLCASTSLWIVIKWHIYAVTIAFRRAHITTEQFEYVGVRLRYLDKYAKLLWNVLYLVMCAEWQWVTYSGHKSIYLWQRYSLCNTINLPIFVPVTLTFGFWRRSRILMSFWIQQ